jgi:uncharacterized protein YprB with RNaseH-like and TPR domain
MSILGHLRYRNDSIHSDIFFFDIRTTGVDVECRIEVCVASTQQDILDIKIDVDAHLWSW